MVGDRGLREPENLDELTDAHRLTRAGEHIENPDASGISERTEEQGRRFCVRVGERG